MGHGTQFASIWLKTEEDVCMYVCLCVYMYNVDMQLYVLKSPDLHKYINCLRSNNIDIVCVHCM